MKLDKEALASATRALGNIASNDLRIYAGTAITAYLAACAEKGFRMMPREVDDRMWEAGRARYPTLDELEDGLEEQGEDVYFEVIPGPINIWEAMFDAA